jgi:DNA-binding NarL/FixJ family response regulator
LESAPRAADASVQEPEALSPQEERVMTLVVEGKTNKQIAAAIGLSEKTVKNYLYNAFQKLGVGRRAHAATVFDFKRLQRARRLHSDGSGAKPK